MLAAAAAPFAPAEETPGLVKEKPADGRYVETDQGYMVPYKTTIPGSNVQFEMVPIPGGTFKMGSPDDEEDRDDDEGPQFEVQVEPFWMGKYEVTWGEYQEYMKLVDLFIAFRGYKMRLVTDENRPGAITAASNLYDPSLTYTNGEDPLQPAVTMTAYSARQYTKLLSSLAGQFYRLPSEAEWEYACRAGTTTAYPFGDDPDDLEDYAWYYDNSDETTQKVGLKKPNAWGLHDMLGNAAELVLDQHAEDAYKGFSGKTVKAVETIAWPKKAEPRCFRGGSYDSDPEDCRSASRFGTKGDKWKIEDPNEPKSPWWYSDEPSLCVGFRIVRPLRSATDEEKAKVWNAAAQETLDAANHRIKEGRGSWGLVDKDLPEAIKELRRRQAAEED